MRETRAETMDRFEWRGARSREAIAEVRRLLARGTQGVTSLVHALLVWRHWTGFTRFFM